MERVLGGADKVILDEQQGGGVSPFVPLPAFAPFQGGARK